MHSLDSINNKYRWYREEQKVFTREVDSSIHTISIVVPTLNMADTIEDTILSIINQNDKNYELIIIDGGSTDGTADIITKYKDFITYYESKIDNGQSSAINRGFAIATGAMYAWINSDDFYLPNTFKLVREVFENNSNLDIVVGSGDVVTKDCQFLKHITSLEMNRENLLGWNNDQWILQQACFWTSNIWEKCGGVDESLQLLMDYDLWLRFSEIGTSKAIGNSLAVMRYYKEAKTIKLRSRMREEEAYVYAKNQAFDQLRSLVSELSRKYEGAAERIDKYENSLLRRLSRKVGLI
jgi:glycosyltransferase involved in cell wall biosynthesis